MKTSDHVTRNQIEAFGTGALAASDSRVIGGHLIRCVECRSLLPFPNSARVWTAITRESDLSQETQKRDPATTERAFEGVFAGTFGKRNRLAWGGGLVAVLVSLGAMIILSVWSEQNGRTDVARSYELENPIPGPGKNLPNERNALTAGDPGSDSTVKSPNSKKSDGGSSDLREKTAALAESSVKRPSSSSKRNISTTRGAITPCTLGKAMDVELGSNNTDLVLRWKPVPNAAKYHLFISDDSEVLIDEFETHAETVYVLRKPLDPTKAYKWKIVITLEDGQNLYVDAQKFTAKDFRSSVSGYKRKARLSTRCLANE